jgi:hypothetical protein
MDLLSRIGSWLDENETTISAAVGIMVLAGVVFAGLRSLVRRRGETAQEQALATTAEHASEGEVSAPRLHPLTVPDFEGRPAIAVLAFDNLNGDPDQEYFADGIAEDLITRLSHWREFGRPWNITGHAGRALTAYRSSPTAAGRTPRDG